MVPSLSLASHSYLLASFSCMSPYGISIIVTSSRQKSRETPRRDIITTMLISNKQEEKNMVVDEKII